NVPKSSLEPRDFDVRLDRTCAPMSNFIRFPLQSQTNIRAVIPINSALPMQLNASRRGERM
ncbi:hypothetical protein ACWD9K_37755, partial [Streptomyces sp. 900116325]